MKVTGSARLDASRQQVWAALTDPAVLVRTIPGCQRLEEVGPDQYRMTLTAGVASIKGVYLGDVALRDQQPPQSFTLVASGAGAPGTVSAEVRVTLTETGGTTHLDYDADATVGGAVGGVGQRVLTGVAKKTAGEFFRAVGDVLTGVPPVIPAPRDAATPGQVLSDVAAGSASDTGFDSDSNSGPGSGSGSAKAVFTAPATAGARARTGQASTRDKDFVLGAVFGALAALAGVLVGARVARTRPGGTSLVPTWPSARALDLRGPG